MSAKDYIIERIVQGRFAKVSAIDPLTGMEVSVVGDASAPGDMLDRLAVKKLEQQLAKQKIQ